ncbi:aquaporin-like protein [Linderina pennispora]|uniref:Aquaporin-like protein n=1 Tax=Linderina pennispora TaxID=61395 RepID=A0A1Y1VY21_9FUNG|nr:aquaporin-like protein [Linderina pennispora]ORX66170.1 aquaporin-like protein [Linderina pennispora]
MTLNNRIRPAMTVDSLGLEEAGITGTELHICKEEGDELEAMTCPRNWFRRFLYTYNAEVAEFLSVSIFMMVGLSIDAQVVFRQLENTSSRDLTTALGWGGALVGGIVSSVGVSGAHLNPALTVSLAVFGHYPWRRVPGMVFAQILGGFVAAFFTWIFYFPIWDMYDGGHRQSLGPKATAGIFVVQPAIEGVYTNANLLFNEVAFTFCLMYFIFFIADKRMTLSATTGALLVALFLIAIILAGTQHIAAVGLNPARDLGPRLFILAAGWTDVFRVHGYYFYVPLVGPFIGAIAACGAYDYVVVPEEVKPDKVRRRYWNK